MGDSNEGFHFRSQVSFRVQRCRCTSGIPCAWEREKLTPTTTIHKRARAPGDTLSKQTTCSRQPSCPKNVLVVSL